MISAKKLIKMVKKWQKLAATSRKRIMSSRSNGNLVVGTCSTASSVVDRGHFVIYTSDKKRFVMPLAYLNNNILRELLKMSEDEFGMPSDGPITLPCNARFMEYVVTLIRRGVAKDLEMELLKSIHTSRCSLSSSFHEGMLASEPFLVFGY